MPARREVWLLRHCEAEDAREPGGDFARVLTRAGKGAADRIGRDLADRGLHVARVVSSPLPRARETAARAAAGIAPAISIEEDRRLAPGVGPGDLVEELLLEGRLPAMLVGHNPDLEILAQSLCGRDVKFKKGTLVRFAPKGKQFSVVEVIPPPER